MKAVVFDAPGEMKVVTNLPMPVAGENETILKVDAVGICGSDLHVYRGNGPKREPGMIMGHEVAGVAVDGPFAGKRFVMNPSVRCGECRECRSGRYNLCQARNSIGFTRPGGFAEYVKVPLANLIDIGNASSVHASLTEPCAVCLHAISLAQNASPRPLRERDTLVIGGGAIGMLTALWLRIMGRPDMLVVDSNEKRRESLEKAGANAIGPSEVSSYSYDLIFDTVGSSQTRHMAIEAARAGAIIVHLGFQEHEGNFLAAQLTRKEIQFMGSFLTLPADMAASVEALKAGLFGSLDWLETRPLDDGPRTFSELVSGDISAQKVVLLPA